MSEIPDIVNCLHKCTLCPENMKATIWISLLMRMTKNVSIQRGFCIFSEIPLMNECPELLNSR